MSAGGTKEEGRVTRWDHSPLQRFTGLPCGFGPPSRPRSWHLSESFAARYFNTISRHRRECRYDGAGRYSSEWCDGHPLAQLRVGTDRRVASDHAELSDDGTVPDARAGADGDALVDDHVGPDDHVVANLNALTGLACVSDRHVVASDDTLREHHVRADPRAVAQDYVGVQGAA